MRYYLRRDARARPGAGHRHRRACTDRRRRAADRRHKLAFDKAALTPQAQGTIAELARRIPHRRGFTVHVDGYTDSIGTPAYNDTLWDRRAAAVAGALKRDLGAAAPAIVARGHGEADPVAPNVLNGKDNPAGRAKNRRVTIAFPHG